MYPNALGLLSAPSTPSTLTTSPTASPTESPTILPWTPLIRHITIIALYSCMVAIEVGIVCVCVRRLVSYYTKRRLRLEVKTVFHLCMILLTLAHLQWDGMFTNTITLRMAIAPTARCPRIRPRQLAV